MNTKHLQTRLEEEKARLEKEMTSVGRKNPSVPNDWETTSSETGAEADLVDQADNVVTFETNRAILADLEARYDDVLAALARIKAKSYGACEACGAHIEAARLEADPAATTCVLHL
jgi:DnaK suppressor protein